MSRHMKKLQLESVGLDAADSGSEEDDVSEEDLARRRFLQFSMSDSSEDEDEDEEPAAGAGLEEAGVLLVRAGSSPPPANTPASLAKRQRDRRMRRLAAI